MALFRYKMNCNVQLDTYLLKEWKNLETHFNKI